MNTYGDLEETAKGLGHQLLTPYLLLDSISFGRSLHIGTFPEMFDR